VPETFSIGRLAALTGPPVKAIHRVGVAAAATR
jgi:hypothetical protein